MSEEIQSGLVEEVRDFELVAADPKEGDTDGTDGGDTEGTEGGDTDGTDGDTDGTDSDGTDGDGTDGDGTDGDTA